MELSLRRWKPGQLLLGWGVYWAGLIGIGLAPAIAATWRATRLPKGHGTISATVNDGTINYDVIEGGVKTFAGSLPFTTAILWLVGPPLVLWLLWLMVRERQPAPQPVIGQSDVDANALPHAAAPAEDYRPRHYEREVVRGERRHTPNP